jgi:hypothetical protein
MTDPAYADAVVRQLRSGAHDLVAVHDHLDLWQRRGRRP